MRKPDLIDALLEVVARTCGLDDDQVARVEARLRADFGGDTVRYLARVGRRQIERRNRRILAELGRGRPMHEIAAALGVSIVTVAKQAAVGRSMHVPLFLETEHARRQDSDGGTHHEPEQAS